uniref:Protein VP5 n=1 Tax=Infectious pancreatic necrosis virus TaxID=11002 RepID=A0A223PIH5_9VIRU|nr:VP5 [Infectious pancreatic necrosis virus]
MAKALSNKPTQLISMQDEHKQSNRNLLEIHYASRDWTFQHSGRHNRETHLKTRDLVIQLRGLRLRKWCSCLFPWSTRIKDRCSLQMECESDGTRVRPVAGDVAGPEESLQLWEADIQEVRRSKLHTAGWALCSEWDHQCCHLRRQSV